MPSYPLLFLFELLCGMIGAFVPRKPVSVWLLNAAAVVAFVSLTVLAAKHPPVRTPSKRGSFIHSALAVLLSLFLLAVVTLPVSVAWSSLIQMRYSFESDPVLEYSPFKPPAVAHSVLEGDKWVDYAASGHPWAVTARTGSLQVSKSVIYALWGFLTAGVYIVTWLLFSWIGNLAGNRERVVRRSRDCDANGSDTVEPVAPGTTDESKVQLAKKSR